MLSVIGIATVFGLFGSFILMMFNSQRDTIDPRGNFFMGVCYYVFGYFNFSKIECF